MIFKPYLRTVAICGAGILAARAQGQNDIYQPVDPVKYEEKHAKKVVEASVEINGDKDYPSIFGELSSWVGTMFPSPELLLDDKGFIFGKSTGVQSRSDRNPRRKKVDTINEKVIEPIKITPLTEGYRQVKDSIDHFVDKIKKSIPGAENLSPAALRDIRDEIERIILITQVTEEKGIMRGYSDTRIVPGFQKQFAVFFEKMVEIMGGSGSVDGFEAFLEAQLQLLLQGLNSSGLPAPFGEYSEATEYASSTKKSTESRFISPFSKQIEVFVRKMVEVMGGSDSTPFSPEFVKVFQYQLELLIESMTNPLGTASIDQNKIKSRITSKEFRDQIGSYVDSFMKMFPLPASVESPISQAVENQIDLFIDSLRNPLVQDIPATGSVTYDIKSPRSLFVVPPVEIQKQVEKFISVMGGLMPKSTVIPPDFSKVLQGQFDILFQTLLNPLSTADAAIHATNAPRSLFLIPPKEVYKQFEVFLQKFAELMPLGTQLPQEFPWVLQKEVENVVQKVIPPEQIKRLHDEGVPFRFIFPLNDALIQIQIEKLIQSWASALTAGMQNLDPFTVQQLQNQVSEFMDTVAIPTFYDGLAQGAKDANSRFLPPFNNIQFQKQAQLLFQQMSNILPTTFALDPKGMKELQAEFALFLSKIFDPVAGSL